MNQLSRWVALVIAVACIGVLTQGCGPETQIEPQSERQSESQPETRVESQSECIVTGLGQELCDESAVAYCDLHKDSYLERGSLDSMETCNSIRVAVGQEPWDCEEFYVEAYGDYYHLDFDEGELPC
jgi:hypothetical protein